MTLPNYFSNRTNDSDSFLAELIEELTRRLNAGLSIDLEELIRNYPEQADKIRRLIPTLKTLANLNNSSAEPQAAMPNFNSIASLGQLGEFLLLREVGRGGMGIVYEAL